MLQRSIYLIMFFFCLNISYGQSSMSWFKASELSKNLSSDDCILEKDDKSSTLSILEFQQRPFFVYIHPQLRQYMDKEYLLECKANVSKVGDNTFLIMNFKINSENAKTNYGQLEKGGKIKVQLINKEYVYLENIERDRGKVKRNDKYTLYEGTFSITKSNASLLKKHSIDKISVLWEEGLEEYEVMNIDLVKNQLNCLN